MNIDFYKSYFFAKVFEVLMSHVFLPPEGSGGFVRPAPGRELSSEPHFIDSHWKGAAL